MCNHMDLICAILYSLAFGPSSPRARPIKSDVDGLEGKVFGVSRYGSGSHIMAYVLAHQRYLGTTRVLPPQCRAPGSCLGRTVADGVGSVSNFERINDSH
jgi:hypothetical protein